MHANAMSLHIKLSGGDVSHLVCICNDKELLALPSCLVELN